MRPGVTYSKAGVYEVDFFTIFHDFLGIVLLAFYWFIGGYTVQEIPPRGDPRRFGRQNGKTGLAGWLETCQMGLGLGWGWAGWLA